MTRANLLRACAFLMVALLSLPVLAQNELAATLEVLAPGVQVQRVNTVNPIAVSVEAIVGVGDTITTDATGRARITFFADGTDVILEPNSQYRIVEFEATEDDFRLIVEMALGQALHRLNRILGPNSAYNVTTPAMTLAARGTEFAIRVEDSGRSAMLVFEGTVDASNSDEVAEVPVEFGIRAEIDRELSDVVRASSFEALDAALDGCDASITTVDDVRLNVRLGPDIGSARVGTVAPDEIILFQGTDTTGDWYRIAFRGGFGWILSSTANLAADCAGLRTFDATQLEDPTLYETLGDSIDPASLTTPAVPVEDPDNAGSDN